MFGNPRWNTYNLFAISIGVLALFSFPYFRGWSYEIFLRATNYSLLHLYTAPGGISRCMILRQNCISILPLVSWGRLYVWNSCLFYIGMGYFQAAVLLEPMYYSQLLNLRENLLTPHRITENTNHYETALLVISGFRIAASIPYLKKIIYRYNICTSDVRRLHLV
ncbi:metalloreductase, partial [Penicillium cinerascens]